MALSLLIVVGCILAASAGPASKAEPRRYTPYGGDYDDAGSQEFSGGYFGHFDDDGFGGGGGGKITIGGGFAKRFGSSKGKVGGEAESRVDGNSGRGYGYGFEDGSFEGLFDDSGERLIGFPVFHRAYGYYAPKTLRGYLFYRKSELPTSDEQEVSVSSPSIPDEPHAGGEAGAGGEGAVGAGGEGAVVGGAAGAEGAGHGGAAGAEGAGHGGAAGAEGAGLGSAVGAEGAGHGGAAGAEGAGVGGAEGAGHGGAGGAAP